MSGLIEITEYIENEDGSATVKFDANADTSRFLIGQGLLRLLEMAMKNEEGYEFKEEVDESNISE